MNLSYINFIEGRGDRWKYTCNHQIVAAVVITGLNPVYANLSEVSVN